MSLFSLSIYAQEPHQSNSICDKKSSIAQWIQPLDKGAASLDEASVFQKMQSQSIVLLGEKHDSMADHQWQLAVIERLHAQQNEIAIGVEMLPRSLQPVLDQWVKGQLSVEEFLEKTNWKQVWGFDWRLYEPIFLYAQRHQISMVALNIDREVIRQVRQKGGAVMFPLLQAEKKLTRPPLAPSLAYRELLTRVFSQHGALDHDPSSLTFFVDAQVLWDRVMAESIVQYQEKNPSKQVVALMGAGHVKKGYGVAHQLYDWGVGVKQVGLWMTWPYGQSCEALGQDFADGLYVIELRYTLSLF